MGFLKNSATKIKETITYVYSENNILKLTSDRYQMVNIVDDMNIILPDVKKFTRIHLFFTVDNDSILTFPQIKYQTELNLSLDKSYEIIFTYTDRWMANFIEYGQDAKNYEQYEGYPLNIQNESISLEHSSYITEIQGNTVNGESLGEFDGEQYIIKFNISTSTVEFGKNGRIE